LGSHALSLARRSGQEIKAARRAKRENEHERANWRYPWSHYSLSHLHTLRSAHGQAQQRLIDEQKTAFFFVTLPEALPIAVISRFIGWFQDFGIPVGVIVNMLLDKAALGQDVPEFVCNRVQMQEEYMKSIWEKFDGSVRALVSLFDQEVRGCAMLREAAQKMMT
jgi:arsenite/tail-anchored protein-transporting ATPase